MSARSFRHRAVAVAAVGAVITACGVAATLPAAADPVKPAAAKLAEQDFFATTKVVSSTGKKLQLRLSAGQSSSRPADLAVTLASGSETHTWAFTVAHGSLVVSGKQSGHVKATSATTHGFARVDVSFTRKGKTQKNACSSANYDTSTAVAVQGTLSFSTKSTGHNAWGNVHVAAKKKALPGYVYATYGKGGYCTTPTFPCSASTGWALYGSDTTYISGGSESPKSFYIVASKSVQLGSYGSREDEVFVTAPKPHLAGSGASATYSVRTSKGQAKGSLTLTATAAPSSSKQTCYVKKKKSSETSTSYLADVTSHGFAVTEQVFGDFTIPDEGNFTSTTVG